MRAMSAKPIFRKSGRVQAGRLGGIATRKELGAAHYRRIGSLGGKARRKK